MRFAQNCIQLSSAMGQQPTSLVALPADLPSGSRFRFLPELDGSRLANLPDVIWVALIKLGVLNVPFLCKNATRFWHVALGEAARMACQAVEEELAEMCASRERAQLWGILPRLPKQALPRVHACLFPSDTEYRRRLGAAQVLHALRRSLRDILSPQASDPLRPWTGNALLPDEVVDLIRTHATQRSSRPFDVCDSLSCKQLMEFLRTYVLLSTQHNQLSREAGESAAQVLEKTATQLVQRAPAAVHAMQELRSRHGHVLPGDCLAARFREVHKCANGMPLSLPLAAEYNFEALHWRAARWEDFGLRSELEQTVNQNVCRHQPCEPDEGPELQQPDAFEPLDKSETQKHLDETAWQALAQKHGIVCAERHKLENSLRQARPLCFEGLPERPFVSFKEISEWAMPDDHTLAVQNCLLLPPTLASLLMTIPDGRLPGLAAVITTPDNVEPWLEFVSRKYCLAHFFCQTRWEGSDAANAWSLLESCKELGLRRTNVLRMADTLEAQSDETESVLREEHLPIGYFGPELPMMFEYPGAGPHGTSLTRPESPRCTLQ